MQRDCPELVEVSLVKLAPVVRSWPKASPEAGARGAVLQPHVDADMLLREPGRPDAVDEHPLAVRGLERLVTRLTPGSGTVETLDSPALPSPKEGASR